MKMLQTFGGLLDDWSFSLFFKMEAFSWSELSEILNNLGFEDRFPRRKALSIVTVGPK